MGLAEVRRAITRSVQADADVVLEKSRGEAEEMIRVTRERIETERATFERETQAMLDLMERRETAAAHARSKAITLEAKRNAINETFAVAAQELAALDGEERVQFIAALCERARDEIPVARIRAASRDVQAIGKAFPNASVLADQSVMGGFIATDAHGSVSVNFTFASILDDVHDKELLPVSTILFGAPASPPRGHGGRS